MAPDAVRLACGFYGRGLVESTTEMLEAENLTSEEKKRDSFSVTDHTGGPLDLTDSYATEC